MELLQRLRNLRTDPLILAWAEDSDVMWLPQYLNGRIRIPFYAMEKEGEDFLFGTTDTAVELSLPQLRLIKMERSDGWGSESMTFTVAGGDSLKCRELFLAYYEEMERYLCDQDAVVLANLKKYEKKIEALLRRTG